MFGCIPSSTGCTWVQKKKANKNSSFDVIFTYIGQYKKFLFSCVERVKYLQWSIGKRLQYIFIRKCVSNQNMQNHLLKIASTKKKTKKNNNKKLEQYCCLKSIVQNDT